MHWSWRNVLLWANPNCHCLLQLRGDPLSPQFKFGILGRIKDQGLRENQDVSKFTQQRNLPSKLFRGCNSFIVLRPRNFTKIWCSSDKTHLHPKHDSDIWNTEGHSETHSELEKTLHFSRVEMGLIPPPDGRPYHIRIIKSKSQRYFNNTM